MIYSHEIFMVVPRSISLSSFSFALRACLAGYSGLPGRSGLVVPAFSDWASVRSFLASRLDWSLSESGDELCVVDNYGYED